MLLSRVRSALFRGGAPPAADEGKPPTVPPLRSSAASSVPSLPTSRDMGRRDSIRRSGHDFAVRSGRVASRRPPSLAERRPSTARASGSSVGSGDRRARARRAAADAAWGDAASDADPARATPPVRSGASTPALRSSSVFIPAELEARLAVVDAPLPPAPAPLRARAAASRRSAEAAAAVATSALFTDNAR